MDNLDQFKKQYLKYKQKYISLKLSQKGGNGVNGGNGAVKLDPNFVKNVRDDGNGDAQVKRNLALGETFVKAFNERNWDVSASLLDENMVSIMPDGTRIGGRDKFLKMSKEMLESIPDAKLPPSELQFGSGDYVAVIDGMTGTFNGKPMVMPDGTVLRPTGKPVKDRHFGILKWKNDKIVEQKMMFDMLSWQKSLSAGKQ